MKSEFFDIMKKRTDTELVEIISVDRDQYRPEAIVAAEDEIKFRNLNIEEIKIKIIEIRERPIEKKHRKAFNKKYILIALVSFLPVFILIISLIFNFFLFPLMILSLIPCGLISIVLANRENKKIFEEDIGVNQIIGTTLKMSGILLIIVGLFGICLMIIVAGK